ncbi:MAG: hypothetical protein K0R54_5642 [Clostridiaceae bacterium]|jgi:hypothetical protein|nr:hypothetical protein [Clostridiaceae bacterium]
MNNKPLPKQVGDLDSLTTENKDDLVSALNEHGSQLADNTNKISNNENNLKKIFTSLDGFLGVNGGASGVGFGSAQLKIRNCRTGGNWASIETSQGVYDWTSLDSQHTLAQQNNQKLYIDLGSNNTLYGTSNNANAILDSATIAAHKNYATALVDRYKGYGYMYSFWNEPDVADQWHYGSNATTYFNIVKDLYKLIKSIDSTAIICMPDLAIYTEWFGNVCELGLLDYTDIMSCHIYDIPENLINRIHKIRTIIRRYTNTDIPIYITEFGWSSAPDIAYTGTNVDEATRAKYVIRYLLLALECNIRKAFIYTTRTNRTNTTNKEDWFGIYDTDTSWTKLPIANAIMNFMASNIDYCYIGRIPSNKNDYIVRLMHKTTHLIRYAYWSSVDSHGVKLDTGDTVTLTDTVQFLDTTEELNVFDIINKTRYDNYSEPVKRLSGYNEIFNDLDNNQVSGTNAHAGGTQTLAGTESHTQGRYTIAYPASLYKIASFSGNTIILDTSDGLVVGNILVIYRGAAIPIITKVTDINGYIITTDVTPSSAWGLAMKFNEGLNFSASAEGVATVASGNVSHTQGSNTIANVFASFAMGIYNKIMSGSSMNYSATSTAFVIGNGTSNSNRNNAFRITFDGNVYASAFNTTGADFAETVEWADGNPNNEDRVGHIVIPIDGKIRKANSKDTGKLFVVAGTPTIVGDSYEDDWKDKYLKDEWGRIQYSNVEVDEVKDSEGNIIIPAHIELQPIINPKWDSTKEYIPRSERKEYTWITTTGKVRVRDDGTCKVNEYCTTNDEGIATYTTSEKRFYVLNRVSDNIITVIY